MIKDLIRMAIERSGGPSDLSERLALFGERKYLTWVTHIYVYRGNTYAGLHEIAEMTGLKFYAVKYAYFEKIHHTEGHIRRLGEFRYMMDILTNVWDNEPFWIRLACYNLHQVKQLCIHEMLKRNESKNDIELYLNVSMRSIYRTRNVITKHLLDEQSLQRISG